MWSSLFLLSAMPLWHPSSKQAEDKVQNDGEYNANYDAGYYGKEKLKAPLLQKYIAGKLAQERNSLPEE